MIGEHGQQSKDPCCDWINSFCGMTWYKKRIFFLRTSGRTLKVFCLTKRMLMPYRFWHLYLKLDYESNHSNCVLWFNNCPSLPIAAFKLVVHSRNVEYIMSMIIDLSCLDCLFLTAFWMLQGILKSTISVFLLAFWVKIMNPPNIYLKDKHSFMFLWPRQDLACDLKTFIDI